MLHSQCIDWLICEVVLHVGQPPMLDSICTVGKYFVVHFIIRYNSKDHGGFSMVYDKTALIIFREIHFM